MAQLSSRMPHTWRGMPLTALTNGQLHHAFVTMQQCSDVFATEAMADIAEEAVRRNMDLEELQNGEHRPTDPAASGDPAGEPGPGDDGTSISLTATEIAASIAALAGEDPGAGGGAVTQHVPSGGSVLIDEFDAKGRLLHVQIFTRTGTYTPTPGTTTVKVTAKGGAGGYAGPVVAPVGWITVNTVGAGGGASSGVATMTGMATGMPHILPIPRPPPFPFGMNHAWDTGPSKPIEDAGIKVGEIIAWRCWSISNGMLKSVAADAMWPTTEPMTGDVSTAGVHAWKTERGALEYGRTTFGVIGRIALWGEVIEHEDGYRAEFGRIVSIDYGTGKDMPPAMLADLRRKYGVGGSVPAPDLPPPPHPGQPHSAVPAVWLDGSPKRPGRFTRWLLFMIGWLP